MQKQGTKSSARDFYFKDYVVGVRPGKTSHWPGKLSHYRPRKISPPIIPLCIAHWDKTQLYWYFSNLCEDRKKICKRVQHNISIITACDIQVIGVRPRGFLY